MASAEEKAKILIQEFRNKISTLDLNVNCTEREIIFHAKECAMLCTEEIIGAAYDEGAREFEYWYAVQRAIKDYDNSEKWKQLEGKGLDNKLTKW